MRKHLLSIQPEIMQIFMAAAVGCISAGLQLIIFNVLRNFMLSEFASFIAIEVAIINNFFLNNKVTFSKTIATQTTSYFRKFCKFNSVALASVLIQLVVLFVGLHFLGRGFIIENMLVIFGIALGFMANYLGYRFLVWNH